MRRSEAMEYRAHIENAVQSLNDNTALRMKSFYPAWEPGMECKEGCRYRCENELWKCRQTHTSQAGWEPEVAPSLWERVCETHTGTKDDPIPYGAGMVLEQGKYYHQDYVMYLCIRDSVNPVYHDLSDLVGHYVEEV